jgi:hypothetical protein
MTRLLEWWRQADPAPPAFLPSYPAREQARREAHLDRYLEAVEAELRAAPRSRPEQAAAKSASPPRSASSLARRSISRTAISICCSPAASPKRAGNSPAPPGSSIRP